MRPSGVMLWLGLGLWSVVAAQSAGDALNALPTCAATCLVSTLQETKACSPTDQTCICTNTEFKSHVSDCVLTSCTPKEAMTTLNVTATICHAPVRNRSQQLNLMSIVWGIVTAILVVVRIAYHLSSTAPSLGWDDWTIIVTLLIGIGGSIINGIGLLPNGLGQDIYRLPFESITAFGRWFYIQTMFYFSQVALLKVSITFFYLRIFGHTQIRGLIIGTLILNALVGAVFTVVAALQCRPVSYYWTRWHGETQGTCVDVNVVAWANGAISIVLDFWMITLPFSQLRSLQMHWKKKIGVASMFGVGFIATAMSILRLQTLVKFASTHNPTWDQFDATKWSTVEINVGITCACMPALRLALGRFFPRILGSTRRGPSQTGGPSGGRSAAGATKETLGSRKRGAGESIVQSASHESQETITDKAPEGIVLSRDFTIDYHDESNLVPLQPLRHGQHR